MLCAHYDGKFGKTKSVVNRNTLHPNEKDTLATLKWQIWEKQPICKRKEIPENYIDIYIKNILDDAEGKYTQKMIEDERFPDRNIVSAEEVFRFMNILSAKKENAFLFWNT